MEQYEKFLLSQYVEVCIYNAKELFNMDNKTHYEKLTKETEEKFGIKEILQILNKDEITADDILKFRTVNTINNPDGSFKVIPNKWSLQSKIILNKGDVANLDSRIETTIGRAIANRLLKIDPFGTFFKYENKPIIINKFINLANAHLIRGEITPKQISKLLNNAVWLTRFADMILPSLSKKVLVTPPSSEKLKKKLVEENRELIENGDLSYVDKVEDVVLKDIIENIKDDPSYMLYQTGKPSVGNHLKQTIGTFSPIYNPITGKYDISEGNLMTGHDTEFYHSMANTNISGTYGRAVGTRDGGSIVKTLYNAMNPLKVGPLGSDCRSTKFKIVKLTEQNKNLYIWNYMVEGSEIILLTPNNIDKYIGKTCNFRSALYCKYENRFEICNICAGEIPFKTNLLSIGALTARVGFNFVNASLKSFHDSTVKLASIDPFNYMKIV